VPRSAFLEGAREAGGTKTYSGAKAKQRTAVPQGAASQSVAVLESDGRKREVAIGDAVEGEIRFHVLSKDAKVGSRESKAAESLVEILHRYIK
jgi:hypothetical protein